MESILKNSKCVCIHKHVHENIRKCSCDDGAKPGHVYKLYFCAMALALAHTSHGISFFYLLHAFELFKIGYCDALMVVCVYCIWISVPMHAHMRYILNVSKDEERQS